MWAVFFVEFTFHLSFSWLGVQPRTLLGLVGIFTMPMLHGSLQHIVSNTIPLILLGSTLYLFYDRIAPRVFLQCYLLTGLLVWLIGRANSIHIGASGLIYGLAGFLISFGFFKKDFKSILISIVIILIYGGMVYGLLPTNSQVSYEGHWVGVLVGIFSAYYNRKFAR